MANHAHTPNGQQEEKVFAVVQDDSKPDFEDPADRLVPEEVVLIAPPPRRPDAAAAAAALPSSGASSSNPTPTSS